ncbi:hypothetical protein BDF21DRAFT_474115 [Thamnidium elegans]|nr:hypothetical protein BDF21DRAFT_474115 [Thamnidium elegans]
MDYMLNCIFIDGSAFDINMRPSLGKPARNTPAVIENPVGIVNVDARLAQMRKKKAAGPVKENVLTRKRIQRQVH